MRGGGEEHRGLCWGDIELRFDPELNKEYLEHNERQTKTRTGVDLNNTRTGQPRIMNCRKTEKAEHPFNLAVVTHTRTPSNYEQWFLRGPIGKNKLNTLLKVMAKSIGVNMDKRLTNTSARKHLCQTLINNNVFDEQAVFWTDHKNVQSLNTYRSISNEQQCRVSKLLCDGATETENMDICMSSTKSTNVLNSTLKSIFDGSNIYGGVINIYFYQNLSKFKPRSVPMRPIITSGSDDGFQ
ncbi:hypothetical protein KUTeg_017569 [Tegillarca granosa]|uniref:Uncharacterized protein n=1 Tax=Tegillarca granosa TaxID=220873 RepID=A0ABQ9EJC7_TEGGR|nr:hypothetical protein KUTeg_017569 [Tegillarca granosa]